MGYFKQFDQFDPLIGEVSDYPITHLSSIVMRARALLKKRTREEIIRAAHIADWFIDEYFRRQMNDYINQILDSGGWDFGYLPQEDRNEEGIRWHLDHWTPEAGIPYPYIPSADNTSDLDALKNCIEGYILNDDVEFPNGRECEYFAVLALWLIADSITLLDFNSTEPIEGIGIHEYAKLYDKKCGILKGIFKDAVEPLNGATQHSKPFDFSHNAKILAFAHAGEKALDAMDAVCYAEQLQALEAQFEVIVGLQNELRKTGAQIDASVQKKVKEQITVNAKEAAIKRHIATKARRQEVFEYWRREIPREKTNELAAEILQNIFPELAHRTLVRYVSEWKREDKDTPPAGKV